MRFGPAGRDSLDWSTLPSALPSTDRQTTVSWVHANSLKVFSDKQKKNQRALVEFSQCEFEYSQILFFYYENELQLF